MENASKALIIAGSILLSILIIALGMYIFSSSSGVTDDTTLSQLEMQTFNGKFNKYKGTQSGTNVNTLLDTLIANYRDNTESVKELPAIAFFGTSSVSKAIKPTEKPKTQSDFSIVYQNPVTNKIYKQQYKGNLKIIKKQIETSHKYSVYIGTNNNTDLVEAIIVSYSANKNAEELVEFIANVEREK